MTVKSLLSLLKLLIYHIHIFIFFGNSKYMDKEDEEVERNSIKTHFTIYSINFNVDRARFGGTAAHCEVNTFFFVYASQRESV